MAIAFLTLIALVLRLILANQSFWLDEGASLMFGQLPFSQLLESIKTDFHPPIFYSLLHLWLPFASRSEWLIRLPFILMATATIPALYLLSRQVFHEKSKVPFLSALFLALNPLHVYYSQELRMYSLATLLVVFSWYFMVRKKYFLVSVFNLLGFFTFYGVIFNIFSQIVFFVITKPKNILRNSIILIAPTTIFFFFWWPIFTAQLSNGHYLTSALPGWKVLSGSLTLKSLALIPLKIVLGRISFDPQKLYLLVGGIITSVFLIISGRSLIIKRALPFWISLLTPLIIGALVSFKTPVMGYWRFLFILPFFMTLLAVGVESFPKIAFLGTVVWICGVFLFANLYFWNNPRFQREDWRGLNMFLSGKNGLLMLAFPYKFAPLNFYSGDTHHLPLETSTYALKPQLKAEYEQAATSADSFFYLDYLADLTDPEREGLQTLTQFGLKQIGVYNFNNLGQLYEFRRL